MLTRSPRKNPERPFLSGGFAPDKVDFHRPILAGASLLPKARSRGIHGTLMWGGFLS
jgi:hypothetical protein